jgi:hypothetical protein
MKNFIGIYLLLSFYTLEAKDFTLSHAKAEYTVKHIFKTVKAKSHDLKGKMVCEKMICEFLVAIATKSFLSSDSNRDLNMQTILEESKYPLITVKGKVTESDILKEDFEVKSLVDFHGIEKLYSLKIKRGSPSSGSLTILLEDHEIVRPSLLMSRIDNEVPVRFTFEWKE